MVVNKGLKLRIFPDEYMTHVLEQNIGNARFIWNNMLSMYVNLYMLFRFHGCPLYPNIRNFNAMLKILKQENVFLREGESTSQQQVFRDLVNAFNKFFKEESGYPKFKSKKNPKQSFNFEFLGRCWKVTIGKTNNYEVDFVCRKHKQTIYVQVCYLLESEDTIEREFRPFTKIKDNYPKYIISMDQFDKSHDGIKNVNLLDFLVDDLVN